MRALEDCSNRRGLNEARKCRDFVGRHRRPLDDAPGCEVGSCRRFDRPRGDDQALRSSRRRARRLRRSQPDPDRHLGLGFQKAIFTGADLYGADLSGSNLSGSDLSDTRLDRSSIIGTDFSKADLSDSTLLRPTTFSNVQFNRKEVANFTGAKLVRTRFFARLDGASFRNADLTEADFSPLESGANTISTVPHNQLSGVDFSNAIMRKANLQQGVLDFAIFRDAGLQDADFRAADLRNADFSGADLTGANFTGANLEGARFEGAKGLRLAKGLDVAGSPAGNQSELKRP